MVQPYIENYKPGEIVRNYRRNTDKLKRIEKQQASIDVLPTCDLPAVSPYFYDTNKLIAKILLPEHEIFVERSGHDNTTDLIYDALKELLGHYRCAPRLVMLSQLRYLALGDLILQPRYYYQGRHVPFVPAGSGCTFDVRVYGAK